MTAVGLIKNLIVLEPAMNEIEAAQNVLNELHRMKNLKGMPFLTIRRAIKMQEKVVKKVEKKHNIIY